MATICINNMINNLNQSEVRSVTLIETPKTRISFQQNICRTCLCKITATNSLKIFSDKQFYNNQTLIQAFHDITHIVIDSKDMLPMNICLKCVEKLKQSISFKKTFEAADLTLRLKVRQAKVRYKLKQVRSIKLGLNAAYHELNEIPDEYETRNIEQIQVDINQLLCQSELPILKEMNKINNSPEQNDFEFKKDIIDNDAIIIMQDTENSDTNLLELIDPLADSPVVEISDDEEKPCIVNKTYQNSENKSHNDNLGKPRILTKPQCNTKKKSYSFEENLLQIKNVEYVPTVSKPISIPPKTLTCDKCDKKFSSADYLDRHLLYHTLDIEPIVKSKLRNQCSTAKLFVRPLSDLTDAAYICPESGTVITKSEHNDCPTTPPEQIDEVCHEVIKEECKYCKKLIELDDLYSHIRQEHLSVYQQERRRFLQLYQKCRDCILHLKNIPEILKHMTLPHEAKFGCKYCDKIFPGTRLLMGHIYRVHHAKPHKLCYVCGKSFKSLDEHLKTHTNKKSLKCTFKDCNTVLKYKSTLNEHMRTVHKSETPYICERCGMKFKQKGTLSQHIRTHREVLPYTCFICEKGFVLRCKLKQHLVTHQTVKLYTCPMCPQMFSNQYSINKHCRKYHPEHNLVRKMRKLNRNSTVVNSTEKCIECTICQKKFKHVYTLNKHNRVKHPALYFNRNQNSTEVIMVKNDDNSMKKAIQCTECKRNFAHEYNLKKHNRTFHPLVYFNQKQKQFKINASIEEIIDHEELYLNKYLS